MIYETASLPQVWISYLQPWEVVCHVCHGRRVVPVGALTTLCETCPRCDGTGKLARGWPV